MDRLGRQFRPFHGGNRGSNPLGDAISRFNSMNDAPAVGAQYARSPRSTTSIVRTSIFKSSRIDQLFI
jgi:hypothetical protein